MVTKRHVVAWELQSRTKVDGKVEQLNRIIGPFHTPYIYVQKRLFVLLLNTPRPPSPPPPPIQCWDMKQQLRTKTV